MLENLILIRHADAEINFIVEDFERTLTEFGKSIIDNNIQYFVKHFKEPDIILCSTATRTVQTADIVLNYCHAAKIYYLHSLYNASAAAIKSSLNEFQKFHSVMIIGHNNGISQFANEITENKVGRFNTADIAILEKRHNSDFYNLKHKISS